MAKDARIGTVLVAGAGIAGIKAALELAELGYQVLLTDSSPHIGGILAKLDYQFPTDHCGLCRILSLVGRELGSQHCMRKSLFHDNIEIVSLTKITSIQGTAGAYKVGLLREARHVNTDVCSGLGRCIDVCPVEAPDEFNNGLTKRKAIYQPVPHNVPQMLLVDMKTCTQCGECVEVCPSNAIDLSAEQESSEVTVDAIVLACGTTLYDPRAQEDTQAYTVSDDVVSSLTFERILSNSGTYDGALRRPSDGKPARRIAWIQCVGSRNRRHGRDYCSSICCMFALKEAVLAHEKGGSDVETTIFYMDMRTFGKDFYRYREKAEETHGVRLVRCRVQEVIREGDGTLSIRYCDRETGELTWGQYDLVVLSTGHVLFEDHRKLAELVGVSLPPSGLLPTVGFERVKLVKPGLFLCGSLMGLTDISEAIVSGIAAAGEVSKLLTSLSREGRVDTNGAERPSRSEAPRIAVILCDSRDEKVPSGLDLEPLRARIERLDSVGEVHCIESLCSDAGADQVKGILGSSRCNRVVFGACLPNVYRRRVRKLATSAGFSSMLVEVFDLMGIVQRGQVAKQAGKWEDRALEEVRAIVETLKRTEAVSVARVPIERSALVVGGGVAGMRAALSLARRGIDTHLVERSEALGGHAGKRLRYTVDGTDPARLCADLEQQTKEHPRIRVHPNSEVVRSTSQPGWFGTAIRSRDDDSEQWVRHGAVILATGGQEGGTSEYGFGESDRILRQVEVERRLAAGDIDAKALDTVVMIQCVGSREKGKREYCSRICCAAALKNAFRIREQNPGARIIVLYRDMMTYGLLEQYYTKARRQGVIFVNYELDAKPKVTVGADGKPSVDYQDPVLGTSCQVTADLLVLATGVEPSSATANLAAQFGLSLNPDGFLAEADAKWRPVELGSPGAFLAGAAHSPQPVADAVMQAEAAAHKAYSYLCSREVVVPSVVAIVHDALCSRCQLCIDVCPFQARAFDSGEDRIAVDPAACQACGACAVACRNNAAEVIAWSDRRIMATIDARLSAGEFISEGRRLEEVTHG